MVPPWLKGSAVVTATVAPVAAIALLAAGPAPGETRPSPGWLAGLQDVFVPDPTRGADYEATFRVHRGWGPPGDVVQVVRRQGGWLRTGPGATDQGSASYVGLSTGSWITVSRDAQGRYVSVSIERSKPSPLTDHRSFRTGERGQAMGEPCEVWSVWRLEPSVPQGRPIQRTGCVTADGIELWRRTGDNASAEATAVTRRRFRAEEVQPPRDLLDLASWLASAPSDQTAADDYEVVLAGASTGPTATMRRHAGWLYEEMPAFRGRSVRSRRADDAVVLRLDLSTDGQHRSLHFQTFPPTARSRVQQIDGSEIVGGERCDWFDVRPGIADAGRTECRTRDGVPLKVTEWSRGWERTLTAVSVSRAKLRMTDVLPSKALLDPKLWGLPH